MSEQQALLMATHYAEINIQATHLMCADGWLSGLRVLIDIPSDAVDAFKHYDHPVLLLQRIQAEVDSVCPLCIVVSPELAGLHEQKYPPVALVADKALLLLV